MKNSNARPVVVELRSGAQYGLPSIADAQRIYPNAKIVRYQDGQAIDPADLSNGDLFATGDEPVNIKMSRKQLEAIATAAGIEGADNTAAYKDKAALIEEIERVRAETTDTDDGTNGGDPDPNADGGDDTDGEGSE